MARVSTTDWLACPHQQTDSSLRHSTSCASTPASIVNADDTEAAFYEAPQSGDIDKLMACWADEDDR
jgi:hypothetical protein